MQAASGYPSSVRTPIFVQPSAKPSIGVVVIGRNEGDRLRVCLEAALAQCARIVYVDSGSTDGSRELAQRLGAEVVLLDTARPFTAARARNAGWRRLVAADPVPRYVQFLDGDCEMDAGWLEAAQRRMEADPGLAVVSGRQRERFPEASIYNLLCDVEWDVPVGPALACAGNACMRMEALQAVGGFDDALIAGEEPELCFRLRRAGWRLERLAAPMCLHDASMHSWRQWWQRTKRSGFAYANGHHLHGSSPERYDRREVYSILAWGLLLPMATLILAWIHPLGWLLLLAYPLQVLRLWRMFRKEGRIDAARCLPYAVHCVAGKLPSLIGLLKFYRLRLAGRRAHLIEYK